MVEADHAWSATPGSGSTPWRSGSRGELLTSGRRDNKGNDDPDAR